MSKFNIIVMDPPYSFFDKLQQSSTKRGAEDNYDVMSNDDILSLPIKEMANPDGALLALWVPSSLLQFGLDLMKAYGFEQKQTYVWVKVKKEPLKPIIPKIMEYLDGAMKSYSDKELKEFFLNKFNEFSMNDCLAFFMGHLFRQTHEICLIGTNSNKIYKSLKNKSQRSVSFGENAKHSAKPKHLQDSLDLMFPEANKIELFARRERDGWICIGNEVGEREDIRVSIQKLIEKNEDPIT